jgi:hypothetical protein
VLRRLIVALLVIGATAIVVGAGLWVEDANPADSDRVRTGATVAGSLVAIVGLAGVWITLSRNAEQQRVQLGPFVRVDVGVVGAPDFSPPVHHFENSRVVEDLSGGQKSISLWAWVDNTQPSALGFAMGVSARFLLELKLPGESPEFRVRDIQVAYVRNQKPVKIELFRVPSAATGYIRLIALTFYDLYQRRHEHWLSGRSENGIYGRFMCEFQNGQCLSIPEAWPRGPQFAD